VIATILLLNLGKSVFSFRVTLPHFESPLTSRDYRRTLLRIGAVQPSDVVKKRLFFAAGYGWPFA